MSATLSNSRKAAIASAKRYVVGTGRTNVHAYVCRSYDDRERFEVLDSWEYEAFGRESRCVAAVWSYEDGRYNEADVFIPNGKIAASVEEYA